VIAAPDDPLVGARSVDRGARRAGVALSRSR
jgi:hypothetical protein